MASPQIPLPNSPARHLHHPVERLFRCQSQAFLNLDPGLKVLRDGWTDPVKSENIMYSGHLHAMVGMYATLFNDDKYDAKGSLTFRYDPIFYGFGPETYEYNHASLNQVIYDQMVASGWHGIPCEPNNVFIVCNQFPILGFRFFDIRKGTNLADQATAGYRAAWEKKGMLDAHGHVDVLVNNAGRSIRRSIEASYDRFHDFERTMQLNYFGSIRLIMGFMPTMTQRRKGHIINISSIGVLANSPRFSAYVASKAALDVVWLPK